MPLPANGTKWPPVQLFDITPRYIEWDAWYSGDSERLSMAYQKAAVIRPSLRPAQFQGGIIGSIARMWWGVPNVTNMPVEKFHVPLASDICQASGDLLYSEAPTFTVTAPQLVQDRLEELVDDGLLLTLAESAEVGAAFGDSYLRVTWDQAISKAPFLTVVHADCALPEFRWGRLTAVTFWHVVAKQGQSWWRHLERHETNGEGVGVIQHGLFMGSPDNLGMAVPLTDVPETAGIQVDEAGEISTESPGLAVFHVPNQRPQRRWRSHPLAANFGRSDLDGIEALMDQIDETYNSWMRDVRLGKSRLLVGQTALEQLDPGQGMSFNVDREIFTPLNLPPGSFNAADGASNVAQAVQFTIRFAEHKATIDELKDVTLRSAGFSTATFGEAGDVALTATEVQARQQRTFTTRGRKIRIQRPVVGAAMEKLLAVDQAIFGGPGTGEVEVSFADGVEESTLVLAQTAQALRTAEAASTEVLVAMIHPDWDETAVTAEVTKIMAEKPAVPDPTTFGFGAPQDVPPVGSQDAGQS